MWPPGQQRPHVLSVQEETDTCKDRLPIVFLEGSRIGNLSEHGLSSQIDIGPNLGSAIREQCALRQIS